MKAIATNNSNIIGRQKEKVENNFLWIEKDASKK